MIQFLNIFVFIIFFYRCFAQDINVDHEVASVYFNKSCSHDDNCHDFRMICLNEACVCSRFYNWSEEAKECILHLEALHEFLRNLDFAPRDYKDELSEEAHNTFFFMALSGAMTATLGLLGALACVCVLYMSRVVFRMDKEDEEALIKDPQKEAKIKDGDGGIADVAAVNFKVTV